MANTRDSLTGLLWIRTVDGDSYHGPEIVGNTYRIDRFGSASEPQWRLFINERFVSGFRRLRDAKDAGASHARAVARSVAICPRCQQRPVQNNGQGSCDACAEG